MADEEIRKRVATIFQRLENDPSRSYFKTAVNELEKMGYTVIPFILNELKGNFFTVHGTAPVPSVVLGNEALIRLGKDAEGIAVLRDSLKKATREGLPDKELFLVLVLDGISSDRAVATLSESIIDIQPVAQHAVVSSLGAFWEKNPEKASLVVDALAKVAGGAAKDSFSNVRIAAIDWLRKIGEKNLEVVASSIPALIEAWRTRYVPVINITPDLPKEVAEGVKELRAKEEEKVREIRATAYTLVWAFADARAIPALSEESKSSDKRRSADAINALGEIGKKSPENAAKVIPMLLESSTDPDRKIRHNSIHLLAIFGDARTVPALIKALRDEEPKTRLEAIEGLRRIGDRRALPELRRISKKDTGIEGDKAYEAMREILKSIKPMVRKSVHRPQRKKAEEEWKITRSQSRALVH